MNWNACLVCQEEKKEVLRGRDNGGSYNNLSIYLPKFSELGLYSLEKFECETNDSDQLKKKFVQNKAVYHHNCVAMYNKKHFERVSKEKKKFGESSNELSGDNIKRSKRSDCPIKINLGELKCLFCMKSDASENLCAAGTLHAKTDDVNESHEQTFTQKLRERATKLNDYRILGILSTGTVVTNELFYHKYCLKTFNNKYTAAVTSDLKDNESDSSLGFRRELNFRRVISYIIEQRQFGIEYFEVKSLEKMYKGLLEFDDIPYLSHVTRFVERLKNVFPSLEKRTLKKKVMVCFSQDINELILKEFTPSSFLNSLLKVIAPIRNEMSKVNNSFKGTFDSGCQIASVPMQLQILCSVLIDGCDSQTKGFSQSAQTISQMIMYQFKKKSASNVIITNRRHFQHRETPCPIYVGLKLYASVRSKTLIQRLFSLGICISYYRCLDICNHIASSLMKKYERDGVFVASSFDFNVFTIIAKDNIDLNAKSTKVKHHFHGITMTAMQFPDEEYDGIEQDPLYDFGSEETNQKLKLPDDYVTFKELPFETSSSLLYPKCIYKIDFTEFRRGEFDASRGKEITWLEKFDLENIQNSPSWSKFHSAESGSSCKTPGKHALMPLMDKKVATLKAQLHCMDVIKKTIRFINPEQVPVDVSDQPVYALSKEVQIRHPSVFGRDKYVCLLGDLHIEQSLLNMHGEIIKGSGLETLMAGSNLSTIGVSTMVDINDIKRSRYCLQIAVVAIYKLLKVAHSQSNSKLSAFEWLDEMSKTSQMCFYWRLILDFQLHILLFVRAIRQGNFELYLETLFRLLKWYFALDKYNYARWATIYWFDLALLEKTCPNVHRELKAGNFSFLKTKTAFSRMGLDQLHEQNNKYVKSVSGATSLVNREDESALVRWELCGPELWRILRSYEKQCDDDNDDVAKHNEENKTFQHDFYQDVLKVLNSFQSNPFQLTDLTVVNNTSIIFDDNIYYNISRLESTGSSQLTNYIQKRLYLSTTSVKTKITLNSFILPGDPKSKKPRGSLIDKRLSISFLTKLRAAITYRRDHTKMLFETEVFNVAQSLSVDSTSLYHGTKSSLLQRFEKSSAPDAESPSSAIIIELSPILRCDFNADTFADFAHKLYIHVMNLAEGYDRVDVICDRYFDDSLKNQQRNERGQGPTLLFEEQDKFPSDFTNSFLKNNNNKERLNLFLADRFSEHHQGDIKLTITKGTGILTNNDVLSYDPLINYNTAEEADQKLVRHMLQCVKSGIKKVVVRTIDTDVVVFLLAYRYFAGNFECNVYAMLATGCDSVSSFFNQGKCKFWDRWQEFEDLDTLTDIFSYLSKMPPADISDDQVHLLEKFVLFVYYGKISDSTHNINIERMREFEYSTHNNLRLLPPSRLGLKEQIKRAAYEAGWIGNQCLQNITLPNPEGYGWTLTNGKYSPTWQQLIPTIETIDAETLTQTCQCTKEKCDKCKCVKQKLQCISFCKCHRRCLYQPV